MKKKILLVMLSLSFLSINNVIEAFYIGAGPFGFGIGRPYYRGYYRGYRRPYYGYRYYPRSYRFVDYDDYYDDDYVYYS